jgi:1-acyl-sn-glycerol-3-phosphate acyltransferase
MSATLKSKIGPLYAVFAIICLILITTICCAQIFLLGFLKLFPSPTWRIYCSKWIDQVGVIWTGLVAGYCKRVCLMKWNITGDTQFNPKQWYLVVANHQSWLDIVILQHFFHRKIPILKFFIKDQLKWVPLFNFAWWAMGFPFMKRYSKEYINKNPHKREQDSKAIQKALKHFGSYPSSIMSFIEGTRLTPQKRILQQSPYTHLLKPKAGGISQIISTMGQQLQNLVDVTIVYPTPNHSLWDFLCNRIPSVSINIRIIPIPEMFTGSTVLLDDQYTQNAFRDWLNEQWRAKDALIMNLNYPT